MKLFALASMVAVSTPALAKTFCTLNRENPATPNQYDQTLLTGEAKPNLAFVLKKEGLPFQTANLEAVFGSEKDQPADEEGKKKAFESFRDARVVFVSTADDGGVTITFAHFDASATDNLLPADFVSSGSLGPKPVLAIDGQNHLAVSCFGADATPAPAPSAPAPTESAH